MPLAPEILLQANASATSRTSSAANAFKPAETPGGEASSFSSVYSRQSQDAPAASRDVPARAGSDKPAVAKDKPVAGKDKPTQDNSQAGDQNKVADSGNSLPVQTTAKSDKADDQDSDQQVTQATDPSVDPSLVLQLPVAGDPALDPAQQQAVASLPVATPVPALPDVSANAADPAQAAAALVVAAPQSEDGFDPQADPLDGLHALQFALENATGKHRATTQEATAGQERNAQPQNADGDASQAQNVVNNLASLADKGASDQGSTESGEKAFGGLIADGLKDTKNAASDTRVDNFAERLAALSQAAQPAKVANPAAASPLAQPLAMHRSGWSEGIVDRVMYLSSQNLKSAEIKLEPAELGRLDIRVNMAPDQQTQVTFMSAHVGVRDALESQVSRLRESFSQQGLGQVDVNVSDQSQQQAQQQAQEQASRAQRGGGRGGVGGAETVEDVAPESAVAASQPAQRVIGSSEIDYYA
ncbi:flagellar hook-length control protein FliK [Pseudomonas sp. DTU_2021_1001937_2_SI_NGA_ILE_001]|uniref:flagellar hook-length control protein FliK n=1 Tax=Pseudomonas sp. DTU_2021_1001937_2_SI_NGA_ILE_001 TaxID=3077589 RepID=UPI0028FC0A7A|nr:flagellar hook-length control protein FliK [Pseudomonas sp. DTU_2021_1001937_2_SI_NGA_ILE_001]WNW11131.1 flagellar hook-length control protein FliK [Pseudomonas sp. DTU_2021_1001937_2_SI_NGA_ILE_001]